MGDLLFDLSSVSEIEENLTKDEILKHVTEEAIFEHYGVAVKKGLFCSKIRKDNHPTCSFYRNKNGKLILKDFAAGSYDCFSYVEALFGVSYYMALRIIANDFNLRKSKTLKVNKAKIQPTGVKFQESNQSIIQVEIRAWDSIDLKWWSNYGITQETLNKFKIYPLKHAWLNDNLFYIFNNKQRCYGYFGGIIDGIELWRLYFPGRHSYKMVGNWKSSLIQGAHMLPKTGDYLVITKSMKDVMCLYEYGITAIAPCSENMFLSEAQYSRLKKRFKRIFLLYDTDIPGVSNMRKIRKEFPDIEVVMIPRDIGYKDISDVRRYCGSKFTKGLITNALEYYGENSK